MGRTAIVTDSNSGITQKEAKELGIRVLPMPFYINGELYFEDITLSQEEFYQRLAEDADISTSQPSPGDVIDLWDELLKEYDEIVHIPMSSWLSNSYASAAALAAGTAAIRESSYYKETQQSIIRTRERAKGELRRLGFTFLDSRSNFIFASHPLCPARELFEALKKENIYVRYFPKPRIDNYLRISIGTEEEMDALIQFLEKYLAN